MSKVIVIRIKKAGSKANEFSIYDSIGNLLATDISRKQLIEGISLTIQDSVSFVRLVSETKNCCAESVKVPISTITNQELADFVYTETNTGSLWKHLTNPTIYNTYYGCIHPYIIEYPLAYNYQDQIIQNVQDYSKVYTYLPSVNGVFEDPRKIQTDNKYFNKVIVYNDQDSSGILNLETKPVNNLKLYMSYPKYNVDSKTITYTKSDNFYQFNTFWNIVKDKSLPLFTTSCESMSLDKEVNQENMNYGRQSFKKATIRAKDVRVRYILDNDSNTHIVSQLFIAPSQLSYK